MIREPIHAEENPSEDESRLIDLLAHYDEQIRMGVKADFRDSLPPDLDLETLQFLHRAEQVLDRLSELGRHSKSNSLESLTAPTTEGADVGLPIDFGKFRLLRKLGQGGSGVVYLAEDTRLQRRVALKIPYPAILADPAMNKRFLREANAAATVEHPNIVKIHESGEVPPAAYIAMEYCELGNLADWLMEQTEPVAPRLAAQVVRSLAVAIQHAHERDILHRDLKPTNILLSPQVDSLNSASDDLPFVPKISDFGLAWMKADGQTATKSGSIVGTVRYMSPEQAAGRVRAISNKSDVYSLGCILYELLAGTPPIAGASEFDTIQKIINNEPSSLRSGVRRGVPLDLDAICLKCLEKDPQKRYGSAGELAEDLWRFLNQRPVIARHPSPLDRVLKWSRRHPGWAALILVIVLGVMTAFIANTKYQLRLAAALDSANEHAATAESRLKEVEEKNRLLKRKGYVADMRRAYERLAKVDTPFVRAILDRYAESEDGVDQRSFEYYYLEKQLRREKARINAHDGAIWGLALSPDGKYLASGGLDKTIKIWDATTLQLVRSWVAHDNDVSKLIYMPDGQTLASASDDKTIKLWDSSNGRLKVTLRGHEGFVSGIAFAASKHSLLSLDDKGHLKCWDWQAGRERWSIADSTNPFGHTDFVLSKDADRLYMRNGVQLVEYVWSHADQLPNRVKEHPMVKHLYNLAISPDDRFLITSDSQNILSRYVLGSESSSDYREFTTSHVDYIRAIAWSPDGKHYASAARFAIEIRDGVTNEQRALFPAHEGFTQALAWASNDEFWSSSEDGTIKKWNVSDLPGSKVLVDRSFAGVLRPRGEIPVVQDKRHADGFLYSTLDGVASIRASTATVRECFPYPQPERVIGSNLSVGQSRVAIAEAMAESIHQTIFDVSISIFDLSTRQLIDQFTVRQPNPPVSFLSPKMAFVNEDHRLVFCDRVTISQVRDIDHHVFVPLRPESNNPFVSPDGTTLVIPGASETRILDGDDFENRHTFDSRGSSLCFSYDSRYLITSDKSSLLITDLQNPEKPQRRIPAILELRAICLDPTNRVLVLLYSGYLMFWDLETDDEIGRIRHDGDMNHGYMAISTDGKALLASWNHQGRFVVQLWDAH